ncbi:MAG TPA: BamA/TamA family outer membrane protein [Gemmatimonadaceae bacterium]|nr:BamA/TamA family outer membrane protein [Gemmatimonadaceae bacterium]
MPAAALAQVPRTQVQCNGQIITEVLVRSHAPTYGGLFERSPILGRLAGAMHVATAPSVIEEFVLLRRGERCSILLRRETERILRAQPFLADASVTAFADGMDGVRVEVVTSDEPSVVAGIGLTTVLPYVRSLTLGNANVGGRGVYVSGGWRHGGHYRDSWLAEYANYQLFGEPWRMRIDAARQEHGYYLSTTVGYPFFSDVQPRAWRVAAGVSDQLIPFRSPELGRVALGLRREYVDLGGFVRLGAPGRLALVGTSFSMERVRPDRVGSIVTDTGVIGDPSGVLEGRYVPEQVARLNLLLGYRQVNFLRVTGFGALTGPQDVRRGVQLGVTLGQSLPWSGSSADATYAALNLYAGAGSPTSFIATEVLGEGRRRQARDEWDALLWSGRLGWYLKPHAHHTIEGGIEFSAGSRQPVPFQLTLGDRRGGARGYERDEVGGGTRVVGRLEERWHFGTLPGTADLGVALYSDVGRLWAGDVPLGETTGYRASVGVGLLAAVPPRSRRMWRLDVAVPLRREAGAGVSIRVTNEDRTRAFWVEPSDLRRNPDRTTPLSVVGWP